MSDRLDAVVIGAGPAGLACAALLAAHGATVRLADEQAEPGGQIYRGIGRIAAEHPGMLDVLGEDYARGQAIVAAFKASGAEYRPSTLVWHVTPEREIWVSCNGRSEVWNARALVVATGAMERPVPVPGWTLPGVMTVGAVQIMLKSAALAPHARFVLAGSGPLVWLVAKQCLAAGANPEAVLDTSTGADQLSALRHLPMALRGAGARLLFKGLAMIGAVQRSGVPVFRGVSGIRIEGAAEAESVAFRAGGSDRRIPARIVALHEGVIPAQQMTRLIGCAHVWDEGQRCFRPDVDEWGSSSVDGVLVAGDGAGIFGARAAEHAGRLAALEALRRIGRLSAKERDALARDDRRALASQRAIRRFLDRLYPPPASIRAPADEIVVCRCEEVTAGAVRDAVRQGCMGPNQAKAFLRVGMGPCQGRLCGPVVSEVIAAARGITPAEAGYYRIRPPLKPIGLGELAAVELGE